MCERISSGIEGLDENIEKGFPKGSLILLAGNPGTGKTVFSAQFLAKGDESAEPGVYVSFAEGEDAFMANLSRHLGVDFKRLEDDGKFKFLDFTTMNEEGISLILDAILDEVQALKARRLVIDSYSAIAQSFNKPIDVRTVVHVDLGKIVEQMGCTTFIIEEIPIGESRIGFGMEEFVADGVIILRSRELDGRLFRELEFVKLRGTELKERKLAFTLKGGFKVFPPFTLKQIEKTKRFQSIPDVPGRFSSGSKDLDEMLGGGYSRGSVVFLEIAETVSTQEYQLFLDPTILNFLFLGRGVIICPSPGEEAELNKRKTMTYGATEDEVNRFLRVHESSSKLENFKLHTVPFEHNNTQKEYDRYLSTEKELMLETGQPALATSSLDSYVSLYGANVCEEILNMTLTRTRKHGALTIIYAKPGLTPLVRRLSAMADVHLRSIREHGCLLLYGIKPRTGLYAVQTDVSNGYLLPKLTIIV